MKKEYDGIDKILDNQINDLCKNEPDIQLKKKKNTKMYEDAFEDVTSPEYIKKQVYDSDIIKQEKVVKIPNKKINSPKSSLIAETVDTSSTVYETASTYSAETPISDKNNFKSQKEKEEKEQLVSKSEKSLKSQSKNDTPHFPVVPLCKDTKNQDIEFTVEETYEEKRKSKLLHKKADDKTKLEESGEEDNEHNNRGDISSDGHTKTYEINDNSEDCIQINKCNNEEIEEDEEDEDICLHQNVNITSSKNPAQSQDNFEKEAKKKELEQEYKKFEIKLEQHKRSLINMMGIKNYNEIDKYYHNCLGEISNEECDNILAYLGKLLHSFPSETVEEVKYFILILFF